MQTTSDRISLRMRQLGLQHKDLVAATGASKGTVTNWISGVNNPTGNRLIQLAQVLGTTSEWLLNGTSPEFRDSESIHFAPVEFISANTKGRVTNVRIPIYKDVKASCGTGIQNFLEDASEYLEIDPQILKLMGIQTNPINLRIIYSAEYSMYPTIAPDSPLFVDISDKDPDAIKNGSVYVFTHNHELRMKRIFVSYAGSKTVKLTSDNPDKNRYPDEFITNEQLNEINFVGRLELALVKP
ncbi:S24 family peptidase [Acinetobacter bereziniae]|uniref:Helix-turn-helix domain-containing protein n=1 Tax=Acinetobacter bereziniae TaxID=106648 RepID=A0A8I1ADF6_ACIBZ|nr:LexA family transcriptional regulator [Acinetobacter bereziniae]ATZ63668.1 Cro/Cl family transcriptional regulator [Acinetobacter bereziniae]MBJ8443812.1 LexA family transcriptional regulator [Acinetobacter bereziniae]MCU4434762.1 helix-turn-helix domain-containing protein [Acinetobacter bereziniae]NUF65130.1 LexA family transcriptional regulator [Acinetobacter bereziniae]NUG08914.1 LexA family transcriptional regulator [Acinetobacter bereziniae]